MKNQTNNIIFFYSFFALGFALILEYGFGLLPCRLCTFQRIPYLIIILIFLFQLFLKPSNKSITILIFLCLLAEMVFSVNHSLLSLGIISSSGCESAVTLPSGVDSLKNALQNNTLIIDCENANKKILGLHLSSYNALASLGFLILIVKNAIIKK